MKKKITCICGKIHDMSCKCGHDFTQHSEFYGGCIDCDCKKYIPARADAKGTNAGLLAVKVHTVRQNKPSQDLHEPK